jgi:hypothetical protein
MYVRHNNVYEQEIFKGALPKDKQRVTYDTVQEVCMFVYVDFVSNNFQ